MAKKMMPTEPDAPRAPRPPRPIAVLERRLQNPFGEGSTPIVLKEPGWTLHVINAHLRSGRYHDVVRNKGWVPVAPEEIDGDPEDFGFDVKEGRVVRGERGSEILVKMPTRDYERIQMAKDAYNKRLIKPKAVREAALQKAATTFGDSAAEAIDRTVRFIAERGPVPLDGEGESA
jgi:hypothetical protein